VLTLSALAVVGVCAAALWALRSAPALTEREPAAER
jgi:hypothetical protein